MVLVLPHWSSACKAFVSAIQEKQRPYRAQRARSSSPDRSKTPIPPSTPQSSDPPADVKKMDQLDGLVTSIQSLSGSVEDLHKLNTELKGAGELIQRNIVILNEALGVLDPESHSLGYLYLLDAQARCIELPQSSDAVIANIRSFILKCSPEQIRVAPGKFTELCRCLKDLCIAANKPGLAAQPLLTAITKLQPSPDYLTPQHADFLQCCLLAKLYPAASKMLLKDDIFEVDPVATGLVPKDFLLYCYYGGLILIGMKEYRPALQLLLHSVTAPALAVSAITVAAYKKYAIVSLIHRGSVPQFPRYVSAIVQRHLKNWCAEYNELANAYKKNTMEELSACVTTHQATFQADGNLGLVKQCVESLYKRGIQRLTQTYLTLSLQDIATAVGLPSPRHAELRILRMIDAGEIHASISQKDGMVSFMEDPEQYNTSETLERLDGEIHNMIKLANKVAAVDEQVTTSRAYISKMMVKERHGRFNDDFDMTTAQ